MAILHATQASLTRRVIDYAKKEKDYPDIVRTFSMTILARYRGLGPQQSIPMFIDERFLPSSPDEVMKPKPLGLFLSLVKSSVARHYRMAYERNETDKENKESENKESIPQTPAAEEPKSPENDLDRTKWGPKQPTTEGPILEESQQSKPSEETPSESKTQPLSIQMSAFKEKFGEDASNSGPRAKQPTVSEAGVASYPRAPKISDEQKDATCPICKKVLPANEFEGLSWM